MNDAQKAFAKLIDGVGNAFFYITPAEFLLIDKKLADEPVKAPKVVKKAPKNIRKNALREDKK